MKTWKVRLVEDGRPLPLAREYIDLRRGDEVTITRKLKLPVDTVIFTAQLAIKRRNTATATVVYRKDGAVRTVGEEVFVDFVFNEDDYGDMPLVGYLYGEIELLSGEGMTVAFGRLRVLPSGAPDKHVVSIDVLDAVSVSEGGTANPPLVVARNVAGEIVENPSISYSSLDATKATVNPVTGIVTGVLAPSNTSLRVTIGSVTADAAITVTVPTELEFLQNHFPDSATLFSGIYSVRDGLTMAAGEASKWSDARGAGFGPDWVVGGWEPEPDPAVVFGLAVVNENNPETRYLTSGAGRGLRTPVSEKFNLSSNAKAFAIVGVINSPFGTVANEVLVMAGTPVPPSKPEYHFGELVNDEPGGIATKFFDSPASTAYTYPHRKAGPKMRLFIPSLSEGFSRVDTHPYIMDDVVNLDSGSTALTPGSPTNHPQSLYFPAGSYMQLRAVLPISRRPTTAEQRLLGVWAARYHGAIINTPVAVSFDGDSITQGGAASDYRLGWAQRVSHRAEFALVDDANWGSGGSYIGNWPTVANESFGSGMARRTPFILDFFAHSPATKKVAFLAGGTNDISYHMPGSYDLTELLRRLWQVVDQYTAAGVKPIICTVIPNSIHDATQETIRINFNAAIRAQAVAHGADVCDFCSLAEFDSQADCAGPNYLDGTHPNDAGNLIMSDFAAGRLTAVLAALP